MIFICFIGTMPLQSLAQHQLVMVRNDAVVARYFVGDDFKCKLKNGRQLDGRIHDMAEFYIVTSDDTIQLQSIAAVDSRGYWRTNVMRDVGFIFLYGGGGYFAGGYIQKRVGGGA